MRNMCILVCLNGQIIIMMMMMMINSVRWVGLREKLCECLFQVLLVFDDKRERLFNILE